MPLLYFKALYLTVIDDRSQLGAAHLEDFITEYKIVLY